MRLGRGLVAKIAVGVVVLGIIGFGASSIIRDKAEREYERRETVARRHMTGAA